MVHAIIELKERMQATIDLYQGILPKKDYEPEIRAYVKAINELEKYYYGEKHTEIEVVLINTS